MKRQFSRRRNSLIGRSFLGPAALATLGFVVLFFILRLVAPGAIAMLASPLWGAGSMLSASAGTSASFFTDRATLVRERDGLIAEVARLESERAQAAAKAEDLERLLGARTEPERGIVAAVRARPPVSPYDVLVLDQGTAAGIASGMQVTGNGGTPLGTIESVTGSSARVLLYSAPGRETESWVGDARLPLTLVGQGSGAFSATVSREAGVAVGDLVYVAGSGAMPIGSVASVGNDPSSPRSSVTIHPLANPFSLPWVSVTP